MQNIFILLVRYHDGRTSDQVLSCILMYFNLVYRIYNYLQAVLNAVQITVLETLVWFGHHCFCKKIYLLRIL